MFSYSEKENKLFNEVKKEFYTDMNDQDYSYDYGHNHPTIIKIGYDHVGCMALQGFSNHDYPAIKIIYLYIYKQNEGKGSFILSRLCSLADKYSVIIELDAIPQKKNENTISREKLVSWYQSYGFSLEIEGSYLMRRYIKV